MKIIFEATQNPVAKMNADERANYILNNVDIDDLYLSYQTGNVGNYYNAYKLKVTSFKKMLDKFGDACVVGRGSYRDDENGRPKNVKFEVNIRFRHDNSTYINFDVLNDREHRKHIFIGKENPERLNGEDRAFHLLSY